MRAAYIKHPGRDNVASLWCNRRREMIEVVGGRNVRELVHKHLGEDGIIHRDVWAVAAMLGEAGHCCMGKRVRSDQKEGKEKNGRRNQEKTQRNKKNACASEQRGKCQHNIRKSQVARVDAQDHGNHGCSGGRSNRRSVRPGGRKTRIWGAKPQLGSRASCGQASMQGCRCMHEEETVPMLAYRDGGVAGGEARQPNTPVAQIAAQQATEAVWQPGTNFMHNTRHAHTLGVVLHGLNMGPGCRKSNHPHGSVRTVKCMQLSTGAAKKCS